MGEQWRPNYRENFLCWLLGHRWRVVRDQRPEWPNSLSECTRCWWMYEENWPEENKLVIHNPQRRGLAKP